MKTVFLKVVLLVILLVFVLSFYLPCSAKSVEDAKEETACAEFKITVPRAVAACGAVLLFTASQIIIFKHTYKE